MQPSKTGFRSTVSPEIFPVLCTRNFPALIELKRSRIGLPEGGPLRSALIIVGEDGVNVGNPRMHIAFAVLLSACVALAAGQSREIAPSHDDVIVPGQTFPQVGVGHRLQACKVMQYFLAISWMQ